MLKLLKLKFSGIGRFVEEQEIDFTGLGALVQVDGYRVDTSGSSGSGKSTCFKSIDYLLGLNDVSTSVLQSRYTKESLSVTGEFDYNGKPLKITRNKKLLVELNGDTFSGSKLGEEKIDEILGMPRDLFRKIIHKRQKEGGFFLELTPSKTFEFLTDALGLSEIRKHLEKVDLKEKEFSKGLELTKNELGQLGSSMAATKSAMEALGEAPKNDVTQEAILALKSTYEAQKALLDEAKQAQKSLDPIIAQLKLSQSLEIETLELQRPKMLDYYATELAEYRQKSSVIGASIMEAKFRHRDELDKLEASRPVLENYEPDLSKQSEAQGSLDRIRLAKIAVVQRENDRIATVRASISKQKLAASELTQQIKAGVQAKAQAISLAQEIKKIRESLCPTCEQSWATDTAKIKEADLLDKVKLLKQTIQLGIDSELELQKNQEFQKDLELRSEFGIPEGLAELDQEEFKQKQVLESEKARISTESNSKHLENRVKLDNFSQKQSEMSIRQSVEQSSLDQALKDANAQIELAKDALNRSNFLEFDEKAKLISEKHYTESYKLQEEARSLIKKVSEAEIQTIQSKGKLDSAVAIFKVQAENLAKHRASVLALKVQLSRTNESLTLKTDEAYALIESLETADEAKKALKTYLSYSFDDALDAVGDMATKIVRGIPNMANATITLEGTRETKEGKVKEEVNAVISMDGEEGVPIKSLSGGERSSVDLAVDLAVIDLLETRSGMGCDILILDEAFQGLDTGSIEQALEMLKSCNLTKRLIIVEHNPIVSQMVTDKIMVHRDGQTSRIVQ